MKLYISFFVIIAFSLTVLGQVDNRKKSISIPAVKSNNDFSESKSLFPSKPINNSSLKNIKIPKRSTSLNLPKKEFSMFPEEEFGNPGELYEKQINKNLDNLKLSEKELALKNGSTTDQYFGDFKSNGKFVNVVYRDHGYVDGDMIRVLVNDDVIKSSVFLSGGYKGLKIDLQKGFNKIDFLALNQGESGPNTAEFQVTDDKGNIVSSNRWNLATGVKATVIIVKE
ncbi:hypothetical protein A8C32_02985 [Flavivirga aquatica]|uniref:Secreted protein n=1 Tax=Flavivirga aquatica TaxID=1849968 RepID=A0A1E5TAP9_9FLAO|nr:hypothetical protein [Flavivirga aquatica]OEK08428.1 hypothetical protein A8C32_02985 [Flavivirga aquatica]